uniref:Uncharacterized protein n=1 Tax=Meloidogyne incognita TaxID=6306 RepID=A0A914NA01_MELIC
MSSRWGAVSYIIGAIIGSGIFITPTTILNNVNSVGASLLIWILSGIIATLGAFCYVELGTSIRKSGSDFAYLCHVRWNKIAFIFMSTSCLFINPCGLAIQIETFSVYAIRCLNIEFCDESTRIIAHKLISFSLLLLLFFINCFSLRHVVSRVQIISVIAKFVASDVQFNNFYHPFENTNLRPGNIALALFGGLYSYDGWDILNYGIEDVKSPRRTMPFAIIVSMIVCASIYVLINLSFFMVLSVPEMQSSHAVAMLFAEKTMGPHFKYLIALLVCIVLIGSINASLFGGSRFLWASARERHLPAFFSCINREHDSPRVALFVHVVLAMFLSFLGNLEEMISYVAFTVWITALRMLYENRDGDFGKLQSQYPRFLFEIRLGSRPIYRGQSSLNKILYRRARTLFK